MINETVNQTIQTGSYPSMMDYFGKLPGTAASGNLVAIIICLILFFIGLIIINTLSTLLIALLKRTILFIIISLVIMDFFPRYLKLADTQGWGPGVIFLGIIALVASAVGFYIALGSFIRSAKLHLSELKEKMQKKDDPFADALKRKEEELEKRIDEKKKLVEAQTHNLKDMFSKEGLRDSIKTEKSLLSVLIYLIVAEFGVISSPTLSAPSVQVGLMMFIIFLIGAIVFTKMSYKNTKTAILYFGTTFAIGFSLSVGLGILWGKSTLQYLLSAGFFTSDSLVAMITGMGVSLFAGSKG